MIAKKIKKLTKNEVIDNSLYAVGIDVIYESFQEAKSPIDEELNFWTVIYKGFYGVEDLQIVELINDYGMPNFFITSKKVLGKRAIVRDYYEKYAMYKGSKGPGSVIGNVLEQLGKIENLDQLMDTLPDSIKDLINKD